MPEQTTLWFCDKCGQLIAEVDHGWVEWSCRPRATKEQQKIIEIWDIRIVHDDTYGPYNGCRLSHLEERRKRGGLGSDRLSAFLGANGLMRLLEMLADKRFQDQGEALEIIKRLHIPGYEHARRHFNRALQEGVLEHNAAFGYWSERELQAVLDHAASEGW